MRGCKCTPSVQCRFVTDNEDEFQTLFSTKINETLLDLLFVNKFKIFLEVHLKWLQSIKHLPL